MGISVTADKAALSRRRARLVTGSQPEPRTQAGTPAELERYAWLFNARDWDGVRALVGDDCRLELVSKSERRGKQVGFYFTQYAKQEITLRVVRLEGRLGSRVPSRVERARLFHARPGVNHSPDGRERRAARRFHAGTIVRRVTAK